jgi:porin
MSFHFRSLLVIILLAAGGLSALAGDSGTASSAPESSGSSATSQFWTQSQVTGDLWGLRPLLAKDGLTIGLDWVAQGFANMAGGIHAGTTAASSLDLRFSLAVATSGTLYLDLQDHAGPDPSENLVGDLQRFSNWNTSPFFRVNELWYEQSMFNNTWRFKIGKMDANTEFSVIDNGLSFLNSSSQISPTVVDFPTFPVTMLGANLFFTPANNPYYASFGVYDAARGDKFLDFTGASNNDSFPTGGVFIIGENGLKWNRLGSWQADGNFRVGFWGETGNLTKFDGSEKKGTWGFYTIANQTLWKPDWNAGETRGIRMFLEYAQTPADVSIIDKHLGAGVTWTGISPDHPNDILGLGPEYVHISDQAGLPKTFELAAEAFYQYQLAAWASIQPDLQYIVHPGGVYSNALVGTLQITVHF